MEEGNDKGDSSKSFSFKFSKPKRPPASSLTGKSAGFADKVPEREDVDYILSAEGQDFKR